VAVKWSSSRVLVTGGASFIGSHLVDRLVGMGASVRVADDLSSGRMENLATSIDSIDFLKGDLRDRRIADDASRGVDTVFHLAACHGGRGYIDTHPVECSTNMVLDGTVFASAHDAGVERICFASSACVYPTDLQSQAAAAEGGPVYLKEEWADPFVPGRALADGEYGWAKLMGEMALRAYHREHGMSCVSCRLFTAYGERENETHAVIALIAKAFVEMDPYEIWGTGQQDRNFTYVGDIAEGLIRAAERVPDGSAVNIGTAEHIKLIDVVELILDITGFSPDRLQFDTSKPVGVHSRAADLARARKLLGWEPSTSFEEGLRRTIDWYYRTKDRGEIERGLERRLMER
jgi:nucleoside-diphosphate-sugar epimerase